MMLKLPKTGSDMGQFAFFPFLYWNGFLRCVLLPPCNARFMLQAAKKNLFRRQRTHHVLHSYNRTTRTYITFQHVTPIGLCMFHLLRTEASTVPVLCAWLGVNPACSATSSRWWCTSVFWGMSMCSPAPFYVYSWYSYHFCLIQLPEVHQQNPGQARLLATQLAADTAT